MEGEEMYNMFLQKFGEIKEGKCFSILQSEEGMGVVEVILIIVVLIGLVALFQANIKGVVASIFATIEQNASAIQ